MIFVILFVLLFVSLVVNISALFLIKNYKAVINDLIEWRDISEITIKSLVDEVKKIEIIELKLAERTIIKDAKKRERKKKEKITPLVEKVDILKDYN